MMCKNPYIRDPSGVGLASKNPDIRLQSTPFGCGRCLPCRINNKRVWKNRILLESLLYADNTFLSLSYSDEWLPSNGNLKPKHLTLFIKRLRKRLEPKKIRYFAVGEYGEINERPHYHIIIFNHKGSSEFYEEVWGKGFICNGELNETTANYVVGYVVKKMTKEDDPRLKGRYPEFMRCSKMEGGLGYGAVKIMAEKLKKEAGYNGEIIDKIQRGNKKYALGRYLQNKLCDMLDVKNINKEIRLINYQNELFLKHIKKGRSFYKNLISEDSQKRLIQEKRMKIYEKKRTL